MDKLIYSNTKIQDVPDFLVKYSNGKIPDYFLAGNHILFEFR
jgi:hypothetical protein